MANIMAANPQKKRAKVGVCSCCNQDRTRGHMAVCNHALQRCTRCRGEKTAQLEVGWMVFLLKKVSCLKFFLLARDYRPRWLALDSLKSPTCRNVTPL